MKIIALSLEEEVNAALEALCAEKGRDKNELLAEMVRRYVETEELRRALLNPKLVQLYKELAPDDVKLAEQGIADYRRMLEQADQS